jgi:uncharacterized protein DUF397
MTSIPVDLSRSQWRKSTYSGPNSDMCVEFSTVGEVVALRDSKDTSGPALTFTRDEWKAFVSGVKDNEFDL